MKSLEVFLVISSVGLAIYFLWNYRKKLKKLQQLIFDVLNANEEMYQAMALGLYHRFKNDNEGDESPLDFEKFVARVMSDYFGGDATVIGGSGDYGVDIEYKGSDGLYLGQVKCYQPHKNNVSFEPIAIIHSQMVKQNAKAGFVVTTSDFTPNARTYAEGLNIQLINGRELVEYWVKGLDTVVSPYQPEPELA